MKEIKAVPITRDGFCNFGMFYEMEKPESYPLSGENYRFYPDRLTGIGTGNIGFSPLFVKNNERIIKTIEYHTYAWEGIIPLNDSMIIHVAPPSAGIPVINYTQAFIVPKGCMVKINAAVWHLAPLPLSVEELHAIIVLPECTYVNDCHTVNLKSDDWFQIVI